MQNHTCCLFVALLATLGAAQAPSIEQSLSLKSVSNPKVSPDGKHVVYEVSRTGKRTPSKQSCTWRT